MTLPLLRVVLCATSADESAALALRQRLFIERMQPWFAGADLISTQDPQTQLASAVRSTDAILICCSRHAQPHPGKLAPEIASVVGLIAAQSDPAPFVLIVKLEECDLPEQLRAWPVVDFYADRGYERLMRTLWVRISELKKESRKPRPPAPARMGRS